MLTYGHEKFIQQSIEGVFQQKTNFIVELIIANDNSPDETDDIVKSVISNAPSNIQINYKRHSTNLGMMRNFIWALKEAKGKYVAICEGDDYWTDKKKLQVQKDFLESNPEYVICYTDVEAFNENGGFATTKSKVVSFTSGSSSKNGFASVL